MVRLSNGKDVPLRKTYGNDMLDDMIIEAIKYYNKCQQAHLLPIQSTFDRWRTIEPGKLHFFKGNVLKYVCNIQVVGFFSYKTRRWLWGWMNKYIADVEKEEMKKLFRFGFDNDIALLYAPQWEDASEVDGWAMAALALHFIKGLFTYHVSYDDIVQFNVITSVGEVT